MVMPECLVPAAGAATTLCGPDGTLTLLPQVGQVRVYARRTVSIPGVIAAREHLARVPIGMYEGVGSCQGCVGARGRCGCCRVRLLVCRGGVPIKGLAWARVWCEQARLPRHVFALRFAHDGIGGHGQGGLNQFSDRNAG